MNEAILNQLIVSELDKVDSKWPDYHSPHEAYAVIKEEVEELEQETMELLGAIDTYWDCVKGDMPFIPDSIDPLSRLKESAKNAIKEAVQVYVTALRAERLCKPNE